MPEIGATQILPWKGGRQGAFVLMFDDSCASQVQHAIPALIERQLGGTFYINPSRDAYQQHRQVWEQRVPTAGLELGNHTYTHKGVADLADAESEIHRCQAVLYAVLGGPPRLLSYARPGVPKGKWNISDEEEAAILARHHLVKRPLSTRRAAMISCNNLADMKALADSALAQGTMEYLILHGVGGDWHVTLLEIFLPLVDYLASLRNSLWITGHATAVKYQRQRDAAAAKASILAEDRLQVSLSSPLDTLLYDEPLSLRTLVPAGWRGCQMRQAARVERIEVIDGAAVYEAFANGDTVELVRTS